MFVPSDCDSLTAPTNGQVSGETTTFNSTLTFTCDAGYDLTGDATVTCNATGSWDYAAPTCDIKGECNQSLEKSRAHGPAFIKRLRLKSCSISKFPLLFFLIQFHCHCTKLRIASEK